MRGSISQTKSLPSVDVSNQCHTEYSREVSKRVGFQFWGELSKNVLPGQGSKGDGKSSHVGSLWGWGISSKADSKGYAWNIGEMSSTYVVKAL